MTSRAHPWYIHPLGKFLSFILRLWSKTWFIRYSGLDHRDHALSRSPTGSYLVAIWHQDSLGSIISQKGRDYMVMVSRSMDGELIATLLNDIGFQCARGSSKKGGKEAKDIMQEYLESAGKVSLTVDGPKGPAHQVKLGILDLARRTGAPIMAAGVGYSKVKVFDKSWDKFRLALPFSKVHFRFSAPIFIPKETSDLEIYRNQLGLSLQKTGVEAQSLLKNWKTLSKVCP